MLSHMSRTPLPISLPACLAACLAACPVAGLSQEPAPADQRDYTDSPNGCAPATLLNLLRFGDPGFSAPLKSLVGRTDGVRMRFLVDRYFRGRASTVDPARSRWGVHGIACADVAAGFNELLAEHGIAPLASRSLRRDDGEAEADHLHRVRGLFEASLAAGVPPALNLRSYLVKRRKEYGDEARWEVGANHYVLVTRLGGEGSTAGFELEVIDPWKARRTVLYLHREASGRSFRALASDGEDAAWLDGRPFLQVLAPEVPTLRPANLDWSERYLVIANHVLGRY